MKPFVKETGVAVPLNRSNVDTDQIVPKQFLKRIERTGYGPFLFFDWRFNPDGTEKPDFVLNREPYRQGRVLIAGRNFGSGSSREHAVWALDNFGFRAVIAPSYADIFRSNSGKGGLLTVELPEDAVQTLVSRAEEEPGIRVTVDLMAQTVTMGDLNYSFEIDPFLKHCLLEGLDDVGLSLKNEAEISTFEATRPRWMPDARRGPEPLQVLRK
jgi:3-isopropylmalate/(R)-2-methylmalate dehydratase small subunit